MSERIDAVEVLDENVWQVAGEGDDRRIFVSSGLDLLRALAHEAGLSGDGKVVLDFSGNDVTVEGRLEQTEWESKAHEGRAAVRLYRIVEPS